MKAIMDKLAGMVWLFIKPGKFFDRVAKKGKYADCLILMMALAVLIGAGLHVDDRNMTVEKVAMEAGLDALAVFSALVLLTGVWGLFAALIGLRMRPRIAVAITFKEALPRCIRVVSFALAPLALLIFPASFCLGMAAIGLLVFSIIGLSKALSLKVMPSLIVNALVLGAIGGASWFVLNTFFKPAARAVFTPDQIEYPAQTLIGKEAPDILLAPTGGTPMHLSDLKGKNAVIIDFWSLGCMPCRIGLPVLTAICNRYKDRGLLLFAVGDGHLEEEKQYLEQRNPGAIPTGTSINGYHAYMVGPIPHTVVIGKDGIVKNVHIGLIHNEEEVLSREIEAALQAKRGTIFGY